jgi:hypothetical protein
VNEFTRYTFCTPLATKDKATEALFCIMKRAQGLHLDRFKYIHNDQGGEFSSTVLHIAKEELGIVTAFVPARCHESNGLVERTNRTIQEKVRALLIAACLPDSFWSEAAMHAVHKLVQLDSTLCTQSLRRHVHPSCGLHERTSPAFATPV